MICYHCNSEISPIDFFWLLISKDNQDNCFVETDLIDLNIEDKFDLIEIYCCSTCGAEQ